MNKPIRVLCLFTIMNRGGAETMCMNLYRNIDRDKVQFDFLVYYPQRGQYEDEIERLGGRVFRITHLDVRNLPRHISDARAFFKKHPEFRIVHNHMGENGAFICAAAKESGINTIIYHSHTDRGKVLSNPFAKKTQNKSLFSKKQFMLNTLYPIAVRNSTCFIACGENAARVFRKKADKAMILNNSIDLEKFCFNEEKRVQKRKEMNCKDKLIIGNVARINDNKNQRFAIEVMKEVLKKDASAELWLIGDGNRKQELSNMVVDDGYEGNIKFLGIRSDINELMQAMDVFVFPSISEGLPVSCIEAQATGLPCVFSDGFDPNTVVTDNCKVLSLEAPIDQWSSAILSFRHFIRRDMSEKVRESGYDIKESAKKMEKFYLSRIKT